MKICIVEMMTSHEATTLIIINGWWWKNNYTTDLYFLAISLLQLQIPYDIRYLYNIICMHVMTDLFFCVCCRQLCVFVTKDYTDLVCCRQPWSHPCVRDQIWSTWSHRSSSAVNSGIGRWILDNTTRCPLPEQIPRVRYGQRASPEITGSAWIHQSFLCTTTSYWIGG